MNSGLSEAASGYTQSHSTAVLPQGENASSGPGLGAQTVVGAFETCVEAVPNALAVKDGSRSYTYAELDGLANHVAGEILVRLGVEPSPVAIVMGTGVQVILAMLGVLKAGKFYVVLDPSQPATRNQHIVADAQPALIITTLHTRSAAVELCGPIPLLEIGEFPDATATRPGVTIHAGDLAWLIYTSGSTGKPKGVFQNHGNALHNVMRQQAGVCWSPADRMTWLYSPGVMGATRALTAALLHGASLFPRDPRRDSPLDLAKWLRAEQITLFHSVASLFRGVFGQIDDPLLIPDVRLLIFGGESVGRSDVNLIRRHFSRTCRIYTGLGATETGTVSHLIVDPSAPPSGPFLPLGRPVEGVQVRLQDEQGWEVPSGEVGEIVVDSAHLALGYWRNPELTAAKFREVEGHDGVRRYHTGDLGRLDADGLLRHVSRKDFQVKVRGFRIEIGEIETALQEHPSVREAVVLGVVGAGGEMGLGAYCSPAAGAQCRPQELRRFLSERLPSHMVPASITVLPVLPRTPSGKVDRRSLPSPSASLAPVSSALPRGPVEEELAKIWCEVLGRTDFGPDDEFFTLGGHSLSAMQMAARIQRKFRIEVAARAIYEHPTIARQAAYVQSATATPPITQELPLSPVAPAARQLLSFAQERIWFLHQLESSSSAYHISRAFRLAGDVDAGALQKALTAIVARHEILRTVYVEIDGVPAARVLGPDIVALPETVLPRPTSREALDLSLVRFAEGETARPFDLQRDILLRAALGRIDDELVFVLTVHHIAADAWSLRILLEELSAVYAALKGGVPPALPSLSLQYADYVSWQRRRVEGARRQQLVGYWRKALADAPSTLELPADFPRANPSTGRGSVHRFHVPRELNSDMRKLAQRSGTTPFVAWLAAFQVLLARHSGSTDIVVAAPVGGRIRMELEPLMGCFVNTLLFRGNLQGNPPFAVFLARFASDARAALAHDDLPFEILVQELNPARAPRATPLAEVMFAWQSAAEAGGSLVLGQQATALTLGARTAKFELTLSLEETDNGLAGSFEYAVDRFTAQTIAAWADRLLILVGAAVSLPERRIGELPLLDGEQRSLLLDSWSGARATLAPSGNVLDGFARQVARAPRATAIRAAGQELSYAELDFRSNQVAAALVSAGVHAGGVVAICLERRVELGAAMLGVLKAGAAFVPLDPSYPQPRLKYMIRDSGASALIGSQTTALRLETSDVPQLDIEKLKGEPAAGTAPGLVLKPEAVAYVIYTSGSTGEPKGVVVSHRALWQHNCAMVDRFVLNPADRVLQFGALSFDVVIEETFPTWMAGATLVLRSEDAGRSLRAFCDEVATERITVLNLPTAYWHEFVDALGTVKLPACVRLVAIGGEKASLDHLRRWQQRIAKPVTLLNAYGPTEATITATVFEAGLFTGPTVTGSVPIGRPVPGARAYVLDAWGNLAPPGVWGELHLGGCTLAEGYLRREALTRERFVPDRFDSSPGARMYHTGDLVRWLPRGELEFKGRADQQVKWRGFRIELGEIENALRAVSGVLEATVVVREDRPNVTSLVGYITPAQAARNADSILTQLGVSLPAFMVPSELVGLDSLPTSPNGKLDYSALPPPVRSSVNLTGSGPQVFSPVEARVRAIWEEVLGISISSPDSDFFALGGHSLLAVRLFARLEHVFGSAPPLVSLFSHPTIRAFATLVKGATDALGAVPVVTLKAGSGDPLVFVHGAGAGLLWGYTNLAQHCETSRPILAFAPELTLDAASPGRLEDMAARYVSQLRTIQPQGPYRLAGYCFGGNLAYEMARQLSAQGERIALLAVFDSTPSNSDYHRVRLTGRFLAGFALNLALAAGEFAKLSWREKGSRVRTLWRKLLLGSGGGIEAEVEAMIPDRALYTPEEMKLWEAHLRLLQAYCPQPAPVRLVLLRTRRRPLWRSHEATLGWGVLARRGVQIELVRGTHGTLFHEPHVVSLAEKLRSHLLEHE